MFDRLLGKIKLAEHQLLSK